MKIVRLSKDSNLNRIEKVFNWHRFSGRGPDGEKGDTGQGVATGGTTGQQLAKIDNTDFNTEWVDPPSGGGINYDSPIAVNTTSTITPNDGDYFISTAKLLNITGTAGEVFEPAQAGETSRRIWGLGSGLDLITIAINTSGLGIGEQFEIAAKNGESRRWILNAAGDLEKKGGVIKPLICQGYYDDPAQITVNHNTTVVVPITGSTKDNSGQMHDPSGSGAINIIRSGNYEAHIKLGWTGVTSGTDHNTHNWMTVSGSNVGDVNNVILPSNGFANFTRASPAWVPLVINDVCTMKAYQADLGGTSSIKVHSGATLRPVRNTLEVKEIDPY